MIDFDNIEKLIWPNKPKKQNKDKPTKVSKKSPKDKSKGHAKQR